MRCVAIIMVRNGADYVTHCLQHLLNNQIEVAVLDESSSDGTYEICESFKGDGLCHLERVAYPGYFSLKSQLCKKHNLIEKINTDWVIHQDIDECLESPLEGERLSDAILFEQTSGFEIINFDELVFLPYENSSPFYKSSSYYFFEPYSPRLMRAWKKSANLSALESGGHKLVSTVPNQLKISKNHFILKHYIVTSQDHAYRKYSERVFSDEEVNNLGWHGNRLNIERARMTFPAQSDLKHVDQMKLTYDLSEPWSKHYWDVDE